MVKMELTERKALPVHKVRKVLLVLPVQMDKTVRKALKVYKALLVLLVRKALSAQEAVTTRILPPLPFQEIHYKSISKTETQSLLIFLLLGVPKALPVHKVLLVLPVRMDKTVQTDKMELTEHKALKVYKALLVPLVQTDKMELTEQMVLTVRKVHKVLLVLLVRTDKMVKTELMA